MLYAVRRIGKTRYSVLDTDDMTAEVVKTSDLVNFMAQDPNFEVANLTRDGRMILYEGKVLNPDAPSTKLSGYNMYPAHFIRQSFFGDDFGYALTGGESRPKYLLLHNRGYTWEADLRYGYGSVVTAITFKKRGKPDIHMDCAEDLRDIWLYHEGSYLVYQGCNYILRFRSDNLVDWMDTPHCDFENKKSMIKLIKYGTQMATESFVQYAQRYASFRKRKQLLD